MVDLMMRAHSGQGQQQPMPLLIRDSGGKGFGMQIINTMHACWYLQLCLLAAITLASRICLAWRLATSMRAMYGLLKICSFHRFNHRLFAEGLDCIKSYTENA